jgi:hypothetical protein
MAAFAQRERIKYPTFANWARGLRFDIKLTFTARATLHQTEHCSCGQLQALSCFGKLKALSRSRGS